MGRRPNAVVLEFFERGRKLEDASNRYEHTCKRCGERFPKGRIDGLIGHVLRRCLNVTQGDRDLVISHLKHNSPRASMARPMMQDTVQFNDETTPSSLATGGQLFMAQQQQQSALDTLAEVSRQQLDYSSQSSLLNHENGRVMDKHDDDLMEQTLMIQLQRVTRGNAVSSNTDVSCLEPENIQTHANTGDAMAAVALAASPLVQTASAANRRLEQSQRLNSDAHVPSLPALDPRLEPSSGNGHIGDEARVDLATQQRMLTPARQHDADPQATDNFRTPLRESGSGYGMLQTSSSKSKARTRFSDVRRREVREIRKRGACIRCRMLKKSCTDGTPCETCARVESARLWKGGCIRTRIAEEFTLWSTGLFHCLTNVSIPAAIHGHEQLALPGRIEARFGVEQDTGMSFACKRYYLADGGTAPALNTAQLGDMNETLVLLDEGEALGLKIQSYVSEVQNSCIEKEPNPFLHATLVQAQRLSLVEKMAERPTIDSMSGRSCYNLQQDLLGNVLELWVETRIMTSSQQDLLQLQYTPAVQASTPERISWADQSIADLAQPISRTSQSHTLILHQLLVATEARCAKLSKNVMNEIERRVLQRKQVSAFSTFIAAVLLLNCIERMTGLFRSFDLPQTIGKQDLLSEQQAAFEFPAASWPLDDTPDKFWVQGHGFAELLNMLLRLRSLPPNTRCLEDGTLAIKQNDALPVNVNGHPTKDQSDDTYRLATEWLDPLKLNVQELWNNIHRPLPQPDEGIEAWDLRFIAELLLPS